MHWTFPPVSGFGVQGRDLAGDNFATEKRTPLSVLLREVVQNPLDARIAGSVDPVEVVISYRGGSDLDTPYLESIINDDFIARLNRASPPARQFSRPDSAKALIIEDFGTFGLEGDYKNPDPPGPGQNWTAFWLREGEGAKSSVASNGRAGQGKVTLYRSSSVRAVFGLSRRHSDGATLLMGRSSFVRTYDAPGGGRCERHSFWHAGDESHPAPTTDSGSIGAFAKAFGVTRTAQSGLSLVIPYVAEFNVDAAVASLLGDFYLPIARGRLSLRVNGTTIDRSSLVAVAKTYLTDERARQLFSPFVSDYRGFIERVVAAEGEAPITAAKASWKKSKLEDSDFAGGDVEKLKAAFVEGKRVHVRFPVPVRESGKPAAESYFDVHLEMPSDLNATQEAYIRGDLLIGEERPLSQAAHLPPARGLTLVTDEAISGLLADAEEPTHLKWNGSRPRLAEEYDGAKDVVTSVRQAMPRLLALLSNSVSKRDSKALSRFFPKAEESGGTKKPGPGKKENEKGPKQDPPKPPPPTAPRYLRWSHGDSWDEIASVDAEKIPVEKLPLVCRAEFAYEGLDADAFESYDPFDFDLASSSFSIAINGGDVQEQKQNTIFFTVTTTPFTIRVNGFEKTLRRRMRLDYTLSDNAADIIDEQSDQAD